MSVEDVRNRDVFLKFCFMFFINHILVVLGIDEEVVDVLPSEIITFKKARSPKIFDNFLDFQVLTKSGKIMIFEFKKNALRNDDLKQAYEYYMSVYCKDRPVLRLVMIVISKFGKICEFTDLDLTFHPEIIKTKKINKEKDLKYIFDKFENNEKLTLEESSLLVALPLFETGISEDVLVERVCKYIRDKSDCISSEILDEICVAMYLNILEYVDEDKHDLLLEWIDMDRKYEGIIAQIRNEGKEKWMNEGIVKTEKSIIETLLESLSLSDVARYLHKDKSEILKILKTVD